MAMPKVYYFVLFAVTLAIDLRRSPTNPGMQKQRVEGGISLLGYGAKYRA